MCVQNFIELSAAVHDYQHCTRFRTTVDRISLQRIKQSTSGKRRYELGLRVSHAQEASW